ncbi:MAG: cyclic nucleotide-binding domain-containing protein [bacterium]|nr:cyclic nucleotide-binding domain-containing protein [bacterium]
MAETGGNVLKKGEILFLQGTMPDGLYLLQQGSLEILLASEEFNGLDADIILSKSRRVGTIKGKTLVSGFSKLFTGPNTMTVRAAEDSSITRYPIKNGGFKAIAAGDISQTATILRQLYNVLNICTNDAGKFIKLYQNVSRVNDNISLIYKELSESNAAPDLDDKAETLHIEFTANKGTIPEKFSAKFLIAPNDQLFGQNYDLKEEKRVVEEKQEYYDFIKRFLKLDPALFKSILKSDPAIGVTMFSVLSEALENTLTLVDSIYEHMEKELAQLFAGEASWSVYLADKGGGDEWKNSERLDPAFFKNYLSLIVKINSVYEEMTGKKMTEVYPGIKKIHQYYTTKKPAGAREAAEETAQETAGAGGGKDLKGLKRSMHQIFEFAIVDMEFRNRFLKLMNDFKTMTNPLSTESDGRKLRRHLAKMYWDLYKQVYIRSKIESTIPRPVKLMLNFGFMDEELLEESQVLELNELGRVREKTGEIPILMETEFLTKIYNAEEVPSITEMGLNFEGFLREQEKHSGRRKKGEETEKITDEHISKVMYEIDQRLAYTSAVCSGSTSTAFPILTGHAVKGNLKSMFTSKQKVEEIVQDLRGIDFSVFFRETVLKIGDAREIIQEEVLPYIILLPIYGTKTLLWQELAGTNKRSRGRIVVPTFFMGDLKKNMAHTFACFRWELTKTIKGALWADPIDGGVTGEYFDYVNTYKKNNKLTTETKEKIKERFKSLRTNRDRFADDYLTWVMFEINGIMKLNNLVRGMFFKYIPFPKDSREKLEGMPAFNQYANRYKNINKKTIDGYQRRFKKYQDAEGKHPEEIEKFFKFLEL